MASGRAYAVPVSAGDNAVVESLYSTLMTELIHRQTWATRAQARQAIFEFIEVFYNCQQLHSPLGYLTPAEYEGCPLTSHASNAAAHAA